MVPAAESSHVGIVECGVVSLMIVMQKKEIGLCQSEWEVSSYSYQTCELGNRAGGVSW